MSHQQRGSRAPGATLRNIRDIVHACPNSQRVASRLLITESKHQKKALMYQACCVYRFKKLEEIYNPPGTGLCWLHVIRYMFSLHDNFPADIMSQFGVVTQPGPFVSVTHPKRFESAFTSSGEINGPHLIMLMTMIAVKLGHYDRHIVAMEVELQLSECVLLAADLHTETVEWLENFSDFICDLIKSRGTIHSPYKGGAMMHCDGRHCVAITPACRVNCSGASKVGRTLEG